MPKIDLSRTLPQARIPELPSPYFGKVRDCYDLADGTRLLISSDRISAFDRILAVIPWKGQVLTQLARYWFEKTEDIAANHVISYPDPNVVLGKKLTILPVEVVVRGYLAGSTSTSILTQYQKGQRQLYGHNLPEGLRPNQALPQAIITPTSKAFDGGHDEPLTAAQILDTGLLTRKQWDEVSEKALALFARGQQIAAERGLILVDTKYEFGTDAEGNILLADEIHTPDSSRYWFAASYPERFEAGKPPQSFDKDFVRSWVVARCDPYKDAIPEIPQEIVLEASRIYVSVFEAITGQPFPLPDPAVPVLQRMRGNLARYF